MTLHLPQAFKCSALYEFSAVWGGGLGTQFGVCCLYRFKNGARLPMFVKDPEQNTNKWLSSQLRSPPMSPSASTPLYSLPLAPPTSWFLSIVFFRASPSQQPCSCPLYSTVFGQDLFVGGRASLLSAWTWLCGLPCPKLWPEWQCASSELKSSRSFLYSTCLFILRQGLK